MAVRNIRRDGNHHLKEFRKEKEITEDDVKRGEGMLQELTDKITSEIDTLVRDKEEELMAV